MIFSFDFLNTLILLWSYMLIYNLSLFLIFSTLFQFLHSEMKTLQSFNNISSNNFFNKTLVISLFSMAGVPPFWGFFSKLFIFTLLCNSNFFILFPLFFLILFMGLYFYMQNIRFLNSTNHSNFYAISELNTRTVPLYYYVTLIILFFLVFGFIFTEDLILFITWLII